MTDIDHSKVEVIPLHVHNLKSKVKRRGLNRDLSAEIDSMRRKLKLFLAERKKERENDKVCS